MVRTENTMIDMPVIDLEKCNGCGLCIEACGCKAIVMVDGVITVIETEACGWCLKCEAVCPRGAIVCRFEIVIEE
ncbi:MAG: hypothetical protein A2144_00605 [Chloroflexi bacterium RBG_16_50_9]|nr:MAG: hypothetical protein A2144_00605 [Chloroflexi bacterium RBG_16_50_9]